MKTKFTLKEQWWLVLLLFIMCLFGSSSPAWAGAHFNDGYTTIHHQPSWNGQYISIRVMFYDPNGKDGFFMHTQTQSGHDGPAVYINDEWICSPDWQLAWPGKGAGSSEYLEKERGVDGWWGNGASTMSYTKTAKDRNYLVKFWNPGKASDGRFYVNMCIYPDKFQYHIFRCDRRMFCLIGGLFLIQINRFDFLKSLRIIGQRENFNFSL